MNDKPYLLDGKPADAADIIETAKEWYPDHPRMHRMIWDGMYYSSVCAEVLREHGHTVGEVLDSV